jgi:hypothetical protein
MRTYTALATLVLLVAALFQVPTFAQTDARARLRLVVVNQDNAVLPNATVTVYTVDGNLPTTVTSDEKGVAVFPDLPFGLAQVYAKTSGYAPFIDKTTLKRGENAKTATLHSRTEPESSTTGS